MREDSCPALPSPAPGWEISETPETVSSTTDGTLTGSEIYEKVSPLDRVLCRWSRAEGQGTGTGIIMSADGYIITNNHVIEDATTIVVVTAEGQQYTAQLVGADEKTDLAVLKIEPEEELTPAEFGDSDQLQVGDIAYAIGNPRRAGAAKLALRRLDFRHQPEHHH